MGSREVLAKLAECGWTVARIKGSHHHLRHPTLPGTVTVPHPRKDPSFAALNPVPKAWGEDWQRVITSEAITEWQLVSSHVRSDALDPVRLACHLVVVEDALRSLLERLPTTSTGKSIDAADERWREGYSTDVHAPQTLMDWDNGVIKKSTPRQRKALAKPTQRQIAEALEIGDKDPVAALKDRRKKRRRA